MSIGLKKEIVIGILALQGAFVEHQVMLMKVQLKTHKIVTILVKTVEDLEKCDALVIPGGESTTIALLARISGLLEPLRSFIHDQHKPVWGTCAGAILLSTKVENVKKGGQEVLGGIDITIGRNGWGSQVESFEVELELTNMGEVGKQGKEFTAMFIRAPVVLSLHPPKPTSQPITVIARLPPHLLPPSLQSLDPDDPKTIVALRQGNLFLATFHPELTDDNRFHDFFVRECVLGSLETH